MTLPSKARYLIWRGMSSPESLIVNLTNGEKLILRTNKDDLDTTYQVFVEEVYRCPRLIVSTEVRNIVDLGTNFGYTCVYWMNKYPKAHVTTFEPHPLHVEYATQHAKLNMFSNRIDIRNAAAGTKYMNGYLEDDGVRSYIAAESGTNRIPIKVVDFFEEVGNNPIDILKIDIEGAEYEILSDPRFSELNIKRLIMEYHPSKEYKNEHDWCHQRLTELGFDITDVPDVSSEPSSFGMLWAFASRD